MNQALIKHFKISESDIAQIQAALHPHQTILEMLLEKHLIDPVAYLTWAKEHYSLPVLKIEFLNKNNNVEALLDRYKNVFPKNVIPFHELDGVLYVMCLEPIPFAAPQTVQYVLAPLDILQKYSSKNETSVVAPAPIEIVQDKENTNPLFKDLALSKEKSPLDSFSFENISVAEAKPGEKPPPGSEDHVEIKLEDKADIPAGLDFPASPSTPDGIVSDKPVTSVDLQSLKFEGLELVHESHKDPVEEKKAPPKVTVMTAESLAAKHPPKNKSVSTPTPAAAASPEPPMPMPTPAVVPAPVTPPPAPVTAHAVTPIAAASNASTTQFDGILDALKKHFDQTMVLLFNNGNLEPKAWDATWAKASHAQSAIDISTPSIFRIVNETQLPYHGHIIPNPVNESFFNNWNKGQYPEHITICPIIHEKKIYGMVLGSATKENSKKYQLHHVQEIANDAFAMLSSSKAA